MLRKLVIAFALLSLLVSPILALAQGDDDAEWVEFESESGLVKISHPEDWFVADSGDPDNPTLITFANNEDLLERILSDDDDDDAATAGDKGGIVIAFPAEILAFLGIEITEDTTPEEAAEALGNVYFSDDEDAVVELGEADVVELEDQPPVGFIPFTEENDMLEGVIYLYLKDDFAVFGFVAASMGEFDEEFQDMALELVLSYEFSLTADELLELMLGA